MCGIKSLSQVYKTSEQILFDDSSRIILMSDCHRGDGSWADSFLKNQNIYFNALSYYFDENYTYIELGDGDELWENRDISRIMDQHSDSFWMLSRFVREGRAYFIFGNHDMEKKKYGFIKSNDQNRFSERKTEYISLFKNVKVHEGLILRHSVTGDKIFLVHGHQVDFLNYQLWILTRFLIRYFWRPLELFGVNDYSSTADSSSRKAGVEKLLIQWVKRHNKMLISGHTHRPAFAKAGKPQYFNDGSCVHLRCITGIEIADGNIALVKWSVKTKDDGTLFIGRDVLEGPNKLKDYFDVNMYDLGLV